MTLSEHERRELSLIARSLWLEDRALARKLRCGALCSQARFEWSVIAAIACGLGITAFGVHWHLTVCVLFGLLIATTAPIVVGVITSPRHY
jgi:hypothetical protein